MSTAAKTEGKALSTPRHVYEVYIRTTPEKLWEAITNPEFTRRYFYGTSVQSDWKPGSPIRYHEADGKQTLDGRILEVSPPTRLVHTFVMVHETETRKDRPSRVTWEIQKLGETCKLTLVHDDFDGETATFKAVASGWNPILSGIKTLLETGQPLVISR